MLFFTFYTFLFMLFILFMFREVSPLTAAFSARGQNSDRSHTCVFLKAGPHVIFLRFFKISLKDFKKCATRDISELF